jgi:peptide methionine sulfoxide reductase MsrB
MRRSCAITVLLLSVSVSAFEFQPSRRAFFQTAAASSLAVASPSLAASVGGKPKFGDESLMTNKGHGTTSQKVQDSLLYGVDNKLADRICSYNRHFAENAGYFESTNWAQTVLTATEPVTFYDSVTGKSLFQAPVGRTATDLVRESQVHGWPSFRDSEVDWENVRLLNGGEVVSVDGTHLGHNLPDRAGNRYCINLVSFAGNAKIS